MTVPDGRPAGESADTPLHRTSRLRNVCVWHVARERGIALPRAHDLVPLGDGASMRAAADWWLTQSRPAGRKVALGITIHRPAPPRPRVRPLARAGFVVALVILGLAVFATPTG